MNSPDPPSDAQGLEEYEAVIRDLIGRRHLSDADIQWAFLELSAKRSLQGRVSEAERLGLAFARAIQAADGDSKALLRALGLIEKPGRKPIGPKSLLIGAALAAAEHAGVPPESALDGIADALTRRGEEVPERTTLQGWRDVARAYLKKNTIADK